jgi:hypothetical protein
MQWRRRKSMVEDTTSSQTPAPLEHYRDISKIGKTFSVRHLLNIRAYVISSAFRRSNLRYMYSKGIARDTLPSLFKFRLVDVSTPDDCMQVKVVVVEPDLSNGNKASTFPVFAIFMYLASLAPSPLPFTEEQTKKECGLFVESSQVGTIRHAPIESIT